MSAFILNDLPRPNIEAFEQRRELALEPAIAIGSTGRQFASLAPALLGPARCSNWGAKSGNGDQVQFTLIRQATSSAGPGLSLRRLASAKPCWRRRGRRSSLRGRSERPARPEQRHDHEGRRHPGGERRRRLSPGPHDEPFRITRLSRHGRKPREPPPEILGEVRGG